MDTDSIDAGEKIWQKSPSGGRCHLPLTAATYNTAAQTIPSHYSVQMSVHGITCWFYFAGITQLFINFGNFKEALKETAAVTPVMDGALERLRGQEGQLRSARLTPEPLSTWQAPDHEAAPKLRVTSSSLKNQQTSPDSSTTRALDLGALNIVKSNTTEKTERNKRWCFGTYWPSSFKALWSVVPGGCSQGHWSSSDIKESPARLMLSLPSTLCRLNHPARREKFIQEWIKFIRDGFTPSGEGQHIIFHTQPAMSCCWKMTAA